MSLHQRDTAELGRKKTSAYQLSTVAFTSLAKMARSRGFWVHGQDNAKGLSHYLNALSLVPGQVFTDTRPEYMKEPPTPKHTSDWIHPTADVRGPGMPVDPDYRRWPRGLALHLRTADLFYANAILLGVYTPHCGLINKLVRRHSPRSVVSAFLECLGHGFITPKHQPTPAKPKTQIRRPLRDKPRYRAEWLIHYEQDPY